MIRESIVRKKPFLQKAIQFTDDLTNEELVRWSNNRAFIAQLDREPEPVIVINTLEGTMKAYLGDYIIQGIAGEVYPVNEAIMNKSYDFVRE